MRHVVAALVRSAGVKSRTVSASDAISLLPSVPVRLSAAARPSNWVGAELAANRTGKGFGT